MVLINQKRSKYYSKNQVSNIKGEISKNQLMMNSKRIYDAAMIFIIGIAPLGFQYLKENVQMTNLADRIQSDIDANSEKDHKYLNPRILLKEIIDSESQTKIQAKLDQRIEVLKQWKKSSPTKIMTQVFAISSIHTLGGLMYPSAFFLSILSYFAIYQLNFINEFFIISGKPGIFQKSAFSFEKINKLYLYLSMTGIGLAGVSKGLGRMSKNMMKNNFK